MKEIIVSAIVVACLGVLARIVAPYSKRFATWLIKILVNKAEKKITGSKMGTEKKLYVCSKLNLFGIATTDVVCNAIDIVVDAMNSKQADIKSNIQEDVSEEIKNGVDKASKSIENKLFK